MKKVKLFFAVGVASAALSMTSFAGEWKQDASGWWYQNDDGSVTFGIWLVNGTGANIYYSSGTITMTDETLGTVVDLSDLNVDTSVKAMSNRIVEITIPASEVMTGTQAWGNVYCEMSVHF